MPFRDVIGHRTLVSLLARSIARGSLPPSLIFAGPAGVKLDTLLGSLGIGPHFATGNGGEVVCAVLGVIVVLIAGSIWRRRKLQQVEGAAPSAG